MGKDGSSELRPIQADPQRATFLELFFDLVFVFALTRVVSRSVEDLALEPGGASGWAAVTGGGKTLLLLLVLWSVWQGTAWTTSRYDPYHVWLQLIVIIALAAAMVMGVSMVRAYRETGVMFAAAYVIAQISRALILMFAIWQDPWRRRLKVRMLITYGATAVLWITGALLDVRARIALWAAALGVEYVVARTGWVVPWLGRATINKWDIGGSHLAERYQQFFLVALGESILVIGLGYSAAESGAGQAVAAAVALATTVLIWRIYVQRAGQVFVDAVQSAREPATIGRVASDTHLIMVIGVVATAIGYEIAIKHPTAQPEPAWIAMILGGPAIFLAGRARLEREVFNRVSRSRLLAIGTLVLLAVPMTKATPLAALIAGALVLLVIAVLDAKRAWGLPPEQVATPY